MGGRTTEGTEDTERIGVNGIHVATDTNRRAGGGIRRGRWGGIVLAAVMALLGFGGPAGGMGKAPEPPPPVTSLERIARAVEAGEIDPDTAEMYRVFAVVGDERLPERFRGTEPIRDGTPVLRHARSRFEELRPEVQEALRPYLFPKENR